MYRASMAPSTASGVSTTYNLYGFEFETIDPGANDNSAYTARIGLK